MIPTLREQDFIKISHLNVKGYLDHIDDLKADHVISSADVICLTQRHLRKSDTVHPNSQPIKSHVQYRADQVGSVQKGGIIKVQSNGQTITLQYRIITFRNISSQ